MAIVIETILRDDGDQVVATVEHNNNKLTARIGCSRSRAETLRGGEFICEMSLTPPMRARVCGDTESDETAGIFAASGEGVRVVGKVMNIIPTSESTGLYDLYLQQGPEFVLLATEEIGNLALQLGDFVEVLAEGVTFFPPKED